jgi:HSP20 family protein
VPGFTGKELDVQVEGTRLTISGRHESKEKSPKGKAIYSECCVKEIFRSIALPSTVDPSKVNASLKDGVLTIDLPKVASGKSIPIETRSAM